MSLLAATTGPTAMWYLTRATGAVALLLLSASVVLGILGPLRVQAGRWPRFAVGTVHRDVSLLVVVLIVVHVVTTVLDGFAPISLIDGVIPLHSAYRSLWLGLGALSFDLIVALVLTSLLRARLGLRTWRTVHWLAYLSWPVAVLHGLGSGSDAKQLWLLALTAVCVAAAVAAVLLRLRSTPLLEPPARSGLTALTAITPVALLAFTVLGPLQHGWAKTAGTPASLLGKPTAARAPAAAAGRAAAPVPAAVLSRDFAAALSGTLHQSSTTGGELVDISLRLSGGLTGVLRIRLAGVPDGQGGVSLTGSQVDLAAAGTASAMAGRVTSLSGEQFTARVKDAHGASIDLRGVLNIDTSTGQVTGQVRGTPVKV